MAHRRSARRRAYSQVIALLLSSALVAGTATAAWALDAQPSSTDESVAVASTAEASVDGHVHADAEAPEDGEATAPVPPEGIVPREAIASAPGTAPEPVTPEPTESSEFAPSTAPQQPVEAMPQPSTAPLNPTLTPDAAPETDGGDAELDASVAVGPAAPTAAVTPATYTFNDEPGREITPVSGTPDTVTVTGRLVDAETGTPIVNAPVDQGDGPNPDDQVRTDAAGRFTVEDTYGGFTYLAFGPSVQTLHYAASGSLEGTVLGQSYDLGDVALDRGGLLTGALVAPEAPVDSVLVDVTAHLDERSFWWSGSAATGASTTWQIVVPPGEYAVELSNGRTFLPLWWKDAATSDTATPVTVVAGETVGGIDGTLSYGVNAMAGTVTDPDGEPIVGASVSTSTTSAPYRSYSTTTDAQGRYYFGTLEPGSYRISVYPAPGDGVQTYYGGDTWDTATLVSIPAGTPTVREGLDVTVQRGGTVIGTFPVDAADKVSWVGLRRAGNGGSSGGSSSGRVADDGSFRLTDIASGTYTFTFTFGDVTEQWGEPFTLVNGGLHEVDLSEVSIETTTLTATFDAEVDPSSRYVVEVLDADTRAVVTTRYLFNEPSVTFTLRPGEYLVRYTDQYNGGTPTYYAGAVSAADATVIELLADAPQTILLTAGSGEITGTVTDLADGGALADIVVELYRADRVDYSPVATTLTDADGEFVFAGLSTQNYAVRAVGGESLYVDRWFGPSGDRDDATAIEIAQDGSFDSADIALVQGGGISGTFPEALAVPSSRSLTVYANPVGGGTSLRISGSVDSVLDDNGAWILRGVPAGQYTLSGYLGQGSFSRDEPIVVEAGAVTDGVVLSLPAAQIVGTVRSAATGAPVSAYVQARWFESNEWGGWFESRSAYAEYDNGEYRLSGLPTDTPITLRFSRNNPSQDLSSQWWKNAATEAEATPIVLQTDGEVVVADADLAPAIRVEGRVIDALSGEPVEGVYVASASTRADGTFTAFFDTAGPTALYTSASTRHAASTTNIVVPAEGLTGVEIALARGFSISGTVAAANNGAPLSNVDLRITSATDEWSYATTVWANYDGTFRSQALPPGRYKIEARNSSGLYVRQWFDRVTDFSSAQEIVIVDEEVTDLDVRMSLGGVVSGRIVDDSGQPIQGAVVGVATAPSAPSPIESFFRAFAGPETTSPILDIEVTTDADGNFRLPPLDPGDYTLYVYSPQLGTVWYDGKSTRAEADVIHISAGQTLALGAPVQLEPLAEGEVPLTPEQTLSDDFAIVANPADVSARAGDEVVFTALASGTPVPTVQWERRDGGDWAAIDGAIDARLVLPAVALTDHDAEFRAVFTSGDAMLTTDAARLTVAAATTVPAVSAAPVVGDTTTTTATVSWVAPADGGSPITGYRLALYEAGSDDALRVVPVGAITTATLGGLTPGTDYEVSIAAVNAVGEAAASPRAAFATVTPKAPSAPTDVKATAVTASTIGLTWKAPADNGAALTGYRLLVVSGGETVEEISLAAGAVSTTVVGLDADTAYELRLAARNAVGVGGSTIITARTAAAPPVNTVPGAPTGLQLTDSGESSLSVSWAAPVNSGGVPVSGYTVEVTENGAAAAGSVSVTGTSAVIAGLSADTTYVVRVAAINSVGTGAWSEALTATTDAAAPVAPSAPGAPVAGTVTATGFELTWTAPASDGGAPIAGYDIAVLAGGQPVEATVTVDGLRASVSNVAADTEYVVTIAARNVTGLGPASAPLTVRTLKPAPVVTVPDAPGAPRATATSAASVTLEWDAPGRDGGAPITGYVVRVYEGATAVDTKNVTVAQATVTGLKPATAYTFAVEAVNERGASAPSALSATVTTPADVPGAPTGVTANAVSPTGVDVAWQAPASNGGAAITGYVLYLTAGEDTVRVTAPSSPQQVTGLKPGTKYAVTVHAGNSAGTGSPSTAVEVTTLPAPSPTTSPSPEPTTSPSPEPTTSPSPQPTSSPSPEPTTTPSPEPTAAPTLPATGSSGAPSAPSVGELTDANRGGLVVPTSVAAGGTLALSGLTPGASYEAWFFSTPTYAGIVTADAAGRASVIVPKGLAAGSHRLVLVDPASGEVSAWASVTVTRALAATGSNSSLGWAMIGGAAMLLGVVLTVRRRPTRAQV